MLRLWVGILTVGLGACAHGPCVRSGTRLVLECNSYASGGACMGYTSRTESVCLEYASERDERREREQKDATGSPSASEIVRGAPAGSEELCRAGGKAAGVSPPARAVFEPGRLAGLAIGVSKVEDVLLGFGCAAEGAGAAGSRLYTLGYCRYAMMFTFTSGVLDSVRAAPGCSEPVLADGTPLLGATPQTLERRLGLPQVAPATSRRPEFHHYAALGLSLEMRDGVVAGVGVYRPQEGATR